VPAANKGKHGVIKYGVPGITHATGINDYLKNNGTLEHAQQMANHSSPAPPISTTGATMKLPSINTSGLGFDMGIGFNREAVEAAGQDWAAVETFNKILGHLKERKLPVVKKEGDAAGSHAAWKIRAFQQGVLYRTVMLADGCADAWHAGNILASLLCARALIETAALFNDFEKKLSKLCEQGNLHGIDVLILKTALATRQPELPQEVKATSVLTLILKLDKKLGGKKDAGVFKHYEFISEFCHPNSSGTLQLFQEIDEATSTFTLFDKPPRQKPLLSFVLGGFMLVTLIADSLNKIENLLPKVLELSETAGG
jgi:hypothetical protein